MTATATRPTRTSTTHLSPRLTAATTSRVLRQLRHDHRTIAMMLVLPSALLGLLYLLWKDLPTLPVSRARSTRWASRCSGSSPSS
jgi:ABC-2 type transport system permease protein